MRKYLPVRTFAAILAIISATLTYGDSLSFAVSSPIEKAIVQKEDIEAAIVGESALSANQDRPPAPGEAWFTVLDGCKNVIITAPHATMPTREGKLRFADMGTGTLATSLHRLTGARVVYTTFASPSDPNFYDDNDFKRTLATLIAEHKPTVLLDLHGSHAFRPYDVDFGTMGGQSLLGRSDILESLSTLLRKEGLVNQSKDFFPASKNMTVTKWSSNRGVPSIQVEINSTWLSPGTGNLDAHRYAQLLQGLVRHVNFMGCAKPEVPQ